MSHYNRPMPLLADDALRLRHKKRASIVDEVKKTQEYESWPTALRGTTPDSANKSISCRDWNKAVRLWRAALRRPVDSAHSDSAHSDFCESDVIPVARRPTCESKADVKKKKTSNYWSTRRKFLAHYMLIEGFSKEEAANQWRKAAVAARVQHRGEGPILEKALGEGYSEEEVAKVRTEAVADSGVAE